MRALAVLACVGLIAGSGPALAKKRDNNTWSASRVDDPVTGSSTCVVAAYDRVGRTEFSRFGFLYPIVENNSQLGLLVGVSSGGQIRMPTGDILWRVDNLPHRDLKAADNPFNEETAFPMPAPVKTGNPVADKAMEDAMANAKRMTAGLTATSTVASGPKAQEMLREMLAGQSLLYRQAQAAPAYGLPSSQTYRVGQITNEGLRPIPLDASFRAALAQCGIPTG